LLGRLPLLEFPSVVYTMEGQQKELACHADTVMAGVEASWREDRHTDAEIRGGNGAAVRCHRLVLAVSPLLGRLIDDDEEEVLVVLPGVGQKELNLLLLLLYTGEAETYDVGLQELLARLQVSPTDVTVKPRFVAKTEGVKNELPNFGPKCDICGKICATREDLENHVQNQHEGFVCDLCNKTLDSYEDLLQHKSSHKASKNFRCSKCGQVFRWRAEYRRHAETSHGQKVAEMTSCNICSKQIVSKRLNEHIKMVHGNSRPFSCKLCVKKFAKPSELKNHQRIHSGERPFECDICHASFSYSHILSRHKKYHEGSKKFSCNECGKSFLQKNDLLKHSRTHSGEKPYKCDLCSKSFARMDYLKKHNMLHMSDSKFCCSECGELCGSVEGLRKHKKHSHMPNKQENPNIELNSFEDLALQLPSLPSIGGDNVLESISELQAVSLDGGKTIMILNECAEQVYTEVCLEQGGGEVAVVGEAEVLHLQPQSTSLETFPEQTEVLYAVEY